MRWRREGEWRKERERGRRRTNVLGDTKSEAGAAVLSSSRSIGLAADEYVKSVKLLKWRTKKRERTGRA